MGIPLASFPTASVNSFQPHQVSALIFVQGKADAAQHTLLLDDIRIENDPPPGQPAPPTPSRVQAKGYERHVDINGARWKIPSLAQYVIYRSVGGEPFRPIGVQRPGVNRFCDYTGNPSLTASYRVTARTSSLRESAPSTTVSATTHAMTDDELLTMVQEAGFRYYWEAAEPHSGMTRENTPGNDDIVAVGASGFGLWPPLWLPIAASSLTSKRSTGYCELQNSSQPQTIITVCGRTSSAAALDADCRSSTCTTMAPTWSRPSFMMEGLLAARQYFKQDGPSGQALYQRIARLWRGVDWNWFRATPQQDALYWHWSPEYSFHIANRLTGWNEVMITYLEAIASPAHGIPASDYYSGWVGEAIGNHYANGKSYFGIKLTWEKYRGAAFLHRLLVHGL